MTHQYMCSYDKYLTIVLLGVHIELHDVGLVLSR